MISVVLDTNLLKSGSTDFTVVHFVNKLNDIIGEIESNDLYDKVQILIPINVFRSPKQPKTTRNNQT